MRPFSSIFHHLLLAASFILGALAACTATGDIQPGVGAAGVRLGENQAAVEKGLGKPQATSTSGGEAGKTPETTYLLYPSKGIDVLLEGGKVRSIFLYNEGVDEHKKYAGKGPSGIALGSNRKDILSVLGDPTTRGLGTEADLWFRYDTGLEVSFQPDGTIHHLVITRPR